MRRSNEPKEPHEVPLLWPLALGFLGCVFATASVNAFEKGLYYELCCTVPLAIIGGLGLVFALKISETPKS